MNDSSTQAYGLWSLRSDGVAWTLRIGERAAHGIAASPDGRIVYAAGPTA